MNLFPKPSSISPISRGKMLGQNACLIWITGLSGSGKSTLAEALESALFKKGFKVYLLDGDHLRVGLNSDLGFSEADRRENIRRAGEVSRLMVDAGLIVISAFISPFKQERDAIRSMLPKEKFVEVFANCPLEICEQRDVKGLYAKARQGLIPEFTGISSPYQIPENPEVVVETSLHSIDACVLQILGEVEPRIILNKTHD